jgi:hypothetical protein
MFFVVNNAVTRRTRPLRLEIEYHKFLMAVTSDRESRPLFVTLQLLYSVAS